MYFYVEGGTEDKVDDIYIRDAIISKPIKKPSFPTLPPHEILTTSMLITSIDGEGETLIYSPGN